MGQLITWIVPHALGYAKPTDVDFKIMVTFAQFYSTMLGFINYKLYNSINMIYPPKLAMENIPNKELLEGEDDYTEFVAALNLNLKSSIEGSTEEEIPLDEFPETDDTDEMRDRKANEETIKKLKNLFSGCKVFLNREVPKESLVFIIRCFGGEVSFDKTLFVGATFDESDESITHHIIDRPTLTKQYANRIYVQPQWVYDSVNARMLLPVELYFPGEVLPPHLSPFVEEKEGEYVPPEKKALIDLQNGIIKGIRRPVESSDEELSASDSSDEEKEVSYKETDAEKKRKLENAKTEGQKKMKVTEGIPAKEDPLKLAEKEAAEEKRLAIMMMPKKTKRLYNKIVYGQRRKNREAQKLKEKR
ncbi:Pescadillo-like protein, partial [Stegodyphus mimosarum]